MKLNTVHENLQPIRVELDVFTVKYLCPYCLLTELDVFEKYISVDNYAWKAQCPVCEERWNS